MAITTDSTYTVSSGGISYDIIGFSKTLNNYTTDEILAYTYCSSDNTLMKHIQKREQIAYFTMVENTGVAVPWNMSRISSTNISINAGDPAMENYGQDGVYCGIIWLARTSNGNDMYITSSNWSSYKIVTSFKAKNYCYELSAPSIVANNYGQSGWNDTQRTPAFPIWYLGGGTLYYYIDATGTNKINLNNQRIKPYAMFKHDGKVFFVQFSDSNSISKYDALNTLNEGTDPNYYPYIASNGIASFDGTGYAIAAAAIESYPLSSPFPHTYNKNSLGQYGSSFKHFAADEGICLLGQFGGTIHTPPLYDAGSESFIYFNSKDSVLDFWKGIGIKFKGDKVYKPIIVDGYVSGYSDDLTVESDLDNYIGDTQHTVPGTRPSGGGGGDDDDPSDDQGWGGAYSGAGAFSKFYLCTSTDLANLRTWFGGGGGGDQIPDGFDPMGQVLGLLQYPVSIAGTALAPDEITFRSGKTILHTGVSADRSTGGFLHIDCGSVEIPRRMQQRGVPFLDFETSLEIYVPFCGTAPLDVQTCVGKTLTCDMYVATATGDVSAVIAAGGHPVAYMSGNMAESLPISSSGYGMYLAACKSTWGNGVSQVMNQLTGGTTSTIKNVNQAALNETLSYGQTGGWGQSELLAESYNNPAVGRGMAGAASAKGVAAIGLTTTALNVANAASTGYEQYQRVKNASYTSVSGSFTSCAAWNYPFTPYVKITRPHKQIPTGGKGDYKHTAAIPLVETRSLSGAPGLTTCVNPDVSGISNATAQEKDIIYRALVNGVIV